MRRKGRRQRTWWWAVLALILALTGYFTITELENGSGRKGPVKSTGEGPAQNQLGEASREPTPGAEANGGAITQKITEPPPAKMDPCDQVQKDLVDLFDFLDGRDYVQKILSNERSYVHFKEAIKRLTEKPPLPAGDSMDPARIVSLTVGLEDEIRDFRGRITHCEGREDGKYENGIEFLTLNADEMRFLQQIITIFEEEEEGS